MGPEFTKKLMEWHREQNTRIMPWKGESDPYRIWLSEIILQQTRVEQGMAYYIKFIRAFPTIKELAAAPEKVIFKYWEGLGYYTRCRNLIATAKKISSEYQGRFPSSYSEILELPGVGPYTAAAIASFAYGLPHAVVDGNVERVLARYFALSAAMNTASGKTQFRELASQLIDREEPAGYNQAIMDFGATVCKPRNPLCQTCILSSSCQAYQQDRVEIFPVKTVARPRKKRWMYYFIIESGRDKFWIRERTGSDIWQNLYEFVLWETGKIIPHKKLLAAPFLGKELKNQHLEIKYISPLINQTLSHQSITGRFIHIRGNKAVRSLQGYTSVSRTQLKNYPFPKLIGDYIKNFPLI